jgi:hypothetical protein
MHSAGMQPEGGGRFFYRATHPAGMQRCRGFFVDLSLTGTKQSGTLHGRGTLHTAIAKKRTLRAAPERFVAMTNGGGLHRPAEKTFRPVSHPRGMHRPVESPVAFLCIPSGLHPSMNALDRPSGE